MDVCERSVVQNIGNIDAKGARRAHTWGAQVWCSNSAHMEWVHYYCDAGRCRRHRLDHDDADDVYGCL